MFEGIQFNSIQFNSIQADIVTYSNVVNVLLSILNNIPIISIVFRNNYGL